MDAETPKRTYRCECGKIYRMMWPPYRKVISCKCGRTYVYEHLLDAFNGMERLKQDT